jgi:hypothetical protein
MRDAMSGKPSALKMPLDGFFGSVASGSLSQHCLGLGSGMDVAPRLEPGANFDSECVNGREGEGGEEQGGEEEEEQNEDGTQGRLCCCVPRHE